MTVCSTDSLDIYEKSKLCYAGSICYSASSDHLCNDITMRTQLKIPTPDLKGDLKFKAGFRRTPAKVCFSGTINVEDCAGSPSIPGKVSVM